MVWRLRSGSYYSSSFSQTPHSPCAGVCFSALSPEYRELGIPAVLTAELLDYMWPRHYTESDGSLILEDNEQIIKVLEVFGGQQYKRWRIYQMELK